MKLLKKYIQHLNNFSLTARLLMFLAAASLVAWIIATIIVVYTSTSYIKSFFDTQQILMAKTLINLEFEPISTNLPPTESLLYNDKKLKHEDNDALGFALFSATGQVLLTDGEHGMDFPFEPNKDGFSRLEVDDDEWRVLWLASPDQQRIVAVGQELDYRNDMVLEVLWAQLSPWIITLPLLLIIFGFSIHYELRPLRHIAKELNVRKAHDTTPITYNKIPPEIQPIINSLNTLFERIGILIEQERAFIANAAHELRTPLTGLRIQAEVMGMSLDDPETQKNTIKKIMQATNKCSQLIEQLLLLSQIETKYNSFENFGKNTENLPSVIWEKLVLDAYNEMQDYAESRQINLSYSINAIPANNHGIASLWSIALRNMLDNALRYTPHGNDVHICLNENLIYVENTGITIPKDVLPQLGKRFFRPAGQEATGSGLGLAIVNHITNLHGAKFFITNTCDATADIPIDLKSRKEKQAGVLAYILF